MAINVDTEPNGVNWEDAALFRPKIVHEIVRLEEGISIGYSERLFYFLGGDTGYQNICLYVFEHSVPNGES